MRSHAEMRQEAERVLADAARGPSLLYANGTLPALATDVIDLLDELEEVPSTAEAKTAYQPHSWRELVLMVAILVTIAPALLLGRYFGWRLGLTFWLTAGAAYLVRNGRREVKKDDSWWVAALFLTAYAVTYGPFLLVFGLLEASRFGKYLLRLDA